MKINVKRVSNGYIVTNDQDKTEVFDKADLLIYEFVLKDLEQIVLEIPKGKQVTIDFNIVDEGKVQQG